MKIAEQIYRMEQAFADPEVRKSATAMGALLHADFMEIGASSKVFSRNSIIALLAEETDFFEYTIEDFAITNLGDDKILATYRIPARRTNDTHKPGSIRSSLWVMEGGNWLLRFHQGTSTP